MQAGILEAPQGSPDLTRAIMADQRISEDQKQALVRIYLAFRRDYEDEHGDNGGRAPRRAPGADGRRGGRSGDAVLGPPRHGLTPFRRRPRGPGAQFGAPGRLLSAMRRLAVLSLHTSPLAQPGTGDGGGMNVYVRELTAALARSGVACDVFTRAWSGDLPPVVDVEPGLRVHHVPAGPRHAIPKESLPDGGGRVHRTGARGHGHRAGRRAAPSCPTPPSTPTTGCPAWRATASSTS